MNKRNVTAFAGMASAGIIAALVVFAGSHHGEAIGGSYFALCAIGAFAIQWLAFIPAHLFRTEKFFDLTGSLTYITLFVFAVVVAGDSGAAVTRAGRACPRMGCAPRQLPLRARPADGRRRPLRRDEAPSPELSPHLYLQGLWVVLTASAALAAITSTNWLP